MSQKRLLTSLSDTEQLSRRWAGLIPYFLGGLGIAMMCLGIAINYIQTNQKISQAEKTPIEVASVAGVISVKMIKVDVSGAVEKPGVVEIPYDSRVKDVLITAGGLSAKADRNYISKNINLAQRVLDGMKIYFPALGESQTPPTTVSNSNLFTSGSTTPVNGLVNINLASANELDVLPGIGPVTANKIIAGRPYQNISDLQSRKIVANSIWLKIKDKITIN